MLFASNQLLLNEGVSHEMETVFAGSLCVCAITCFTVTGESLKLFPQIQANQRAPWICFRNQAKVAKAFNVLKKTTACHH